MADGDVIPDLAWYTARSAELGHSPRCPFASVNRCPRYYQSLWVLGSAGSPSIDAEEDNRLRKKWEASDLWRTDCPGAHFLRCGTPFTAVFME